MRAIAGLFHSISLPETRAVARCMAAAALVAVLASGHAHAEGITPVQNDALTQLATETLSHGAMVPFAWEQRAALVGLGAAGLYLGASTEAAGRSTPASTARSAAYRLVLPLAGTALGSLFACDSLCDDQAAAAAPFVGAMAGALVAQVLDRDARRQDRSPGDITCSVVWTPTVSVGLGSYTIGVMGRF